VFDVRDCCGLNYDGAIQRKQLAQFLFVNLNKAIEITPQVGSALRDLIIRRSLDKTSNIRARSCIQVTSFGQ
jgi:hypothetical protein